MNKLLSIIIPTRNRQVYCIESLKSILVDIDERCEIVIQDNSNNNSLETLIKELNSNHIVYNYNKAALSFIDNFEEALMLSKGKYFIILGDDDSTTKDILPIVEWMDRENIESISSSYVVDYIWPNDNIEKYRNGYLTIPNYKGKVIDVDVEKSLDALIRNGFLSYQVFNLPRTYHGIVKRSCIDKVKEIGGRYFGGLTPDIYSTVALACIIKKHKVIDFPFSIAGACPASATVNATVGGHSGELEHAPHFKNRGEYSWEDIIPKYYSVETIWAETAIKALKDMRYRNWFENFNMYKLYIYGIYINRKYILKLSFIETLKLNGKIKVTLVKHLLKLTHAFYKTFIDKIFTKKKLNSIPEPAESWNIKNLHSCKEMVYSKILNTSKPYNN